MYTRNSHVSFYYYCFNKLFEIRNFIYLVEGVLSLYWKNRAEILDISKNWRPLSLLNNDYNIFVKILATRLNIVLPKLISPMQTGFMKNRHISDNIVLLNNVIGECAKTNTEAVLISIDFEKAFDTVEWSEIYKALELFGFGSFFVK